MVLVKKQSKHLDVKLGKIKAEVKLFINIPTPETTLNLPTYLPT